MRIEKRRWDDIVLLTLIGEIDAYSRDRFATKIDVLVERGFTRLAFNLRLLTFINSAALGYLIRMRTQVERAGGEILIVQPSQFVRKTLTILGLDDLFPLPGSDAEAIRHFRGDIGDDADLDPGRLPVEVGNDMVGAGALVFRVLEGPGAIPAPPGSILDVGTVSRLEDDWAVFRWRVPAPGCSDATSGITTDNVEDVIRPGVPLEIRYREPLDTKSPFKVHESRIKAVEMVTGEGGAPEAEITLEH
jgi:anti-sigma B factor antagonist